MARADTQRPTGAPSAPTWPEPATSFVGREGELGTIRDAFDRGHRLVTVLGPGGVGKTRLALRFAATDAARVHAPGERADVLLCDLSEASSLVEACSTLARALGATDTPSGDMGAAVARLALAVYARRPDMLLLDNLEQLVEVAAPLLAEILSRAPAVRILATSRERLRVRGECVVDLGPLAVPEPDDGSPERSPAVQLFLERARQVAPGWACAPGDVAVVAELVRRLEGFPLAIELCATRGRVLDPVALLARLERGFDALGPAPRDAPDRHRTLSVAIDWSVRSLAPVERAAFAQAAVFAGGFTLKSAEEVLDLGPGVSVLDVLSALVDKSLLRVARDRFTMYSAIRDHAARALEESGAARATEARHARHFLELGERILRDRRWNDARAALLVERENLTAVHARSVGGARAEVDAALGLRAALLVDELLEASGPFRVVFELLDVALRAGEAAGAPAALLARALEARGRAHRIAGRMIEATHDHERAVAIATESGDPETEVRALSALAVTWRVARRLDEALAAAERAAARCRDLGAPRLAARVRTALGGIHEEMGELERAAVVLAEAEAMSNEIGDTWSGAMAAASRAHVLQEQGELDEARCTFARAEGLFDASDDGRRAAACAGYLASVLHEQGAHTAAHERYERAAERLARFGNPRFEGLFRACSGVTAAALGRFDDARAALDAAERALRPIGDPALQLVLEIQRLHLELAEHGRVSETLAQARRLSEGNPLVARSDDVRFALRVLHRSIAASPRGGDLGPALRIATASRWFQPPSGPRTALDRKRALWLVLHALADERLRAPGHVLSSEALVAAGWPGERILATAGAHRVRVAVATLRNAGLRGILLSRSGGYVLDPSIPVELIPD